MKSFKKFIKRFVQIIILILLVLGALIRNPIIDTDDGLANPIKANATNLESYVKTILDTKVSRNAANLETLNSVAFTLKEILATFCPSVELQPYQADQNTFYNVSCLFKGESRERVIIGAHYDVAFDQPGADDNASGVAGIIELARMISEQAKKLPHDIEIVAYSLEEPPYFRSSKMGSAIHANKIKSEGVPVKYMISVEMIGFYSEEWFSQSYPNPILYLFYPNEANFIALIGGTKEYLPIREKKRKMANAMVREVYSLNGPAIIPGVDFSDHRNYWALGFEAYMVTDTSFYRNDNYHKPSDTIETLNFNAMADVVNGIFAIVND